MRRTRLLATAGLLSLGLLATAGLLACDRERSRPPNRDELVNAHLEGDYAEVLRWCPAMLDDPGADPQVADWCMYGLPAAMRLSLNTDGALYFVRSVCTDEPTGAVKGHQEFREYYVREVSRWVALPMRAQGLDESLGRALRATMVDFGAACQVDPAAVAEGIDTRIGTRVGRR